MSSIPDTGAGAAQPMEPILRMEKIDVVFPGVHALKEVDFELYPGQVRGLIGENGAGKSTLMNVLGGDLIPNGGRIIIGGKEARLTNAKQAEALGISFIHQELSLFPELDIATNVYIQNLPKKLGIIDKTKLHQDTVSILKAIQLDRYKPSLKLSALKIGEQQLVEIGRALAQNTRILILDEPTSSLTKPEIDILFRIVRELKERGVAVVFISHRLDEVFDICDSVTILRDGQRITSSPISDITRADVVTSMIGRTVDEYYQHTKNEPKEELLAVEGLCAGSKLHDINLRVRRGEVVGVYGLMGAGRSEILRSIFGLYNVTSGVIRSKGKPVRIKRVKDAIAAGIGFVTEDRRKEGLVLTHSVKNNIVLANLKMIQERLLISAKKEDALCRENIASLRIATPSPKRVVRFLSGGNQQKVVISKWLNIKPDLLLLDEPTRGVDVGAKAEIYGIIDNLLKEGVGVLLVSSELTEIMGLCDRVVVIKEGRVAATLDGDELTKESLLSAAMGA